jgi:hypothetical protein
VLVMLCRRWQTLSVSKSKVSIKCGTAYARTSQS